MMPEGSAGGKGQMKRRIYECEVPGDVRYVDGALALVEPRGEGRWSVVVRRQVRGCGPSGGWEIAAEASMNDEQLALLLEGCRLVGEEDAG
jgi:hypothetical protein